MRRGSWQRSIGFGAWLRKATRADLTLGIAAFFCLVALGAALQFGSTVNINAYVQASLANVWRAHGAWTVALLAPIAFCVLAIAVIALIFTLSQKTQVHIAYWKFLRWRRHREHAFFNRFFVGAPKLIRHPFPLDGDTIDDMESGVRYRLANIDAPETGDGARCGLELWFGLRAKAEVERLIKAATRVEVRRTLRRDRFGRSVAFVLLDGEDLGEALIARGLAHPWRGTREKWCGRYGALKRLRFRHQSAPTCAPCQ